MYRRYREALSLIPRLSLRPATALRSALQAGYRTEDFLRDLQAGVVVGVVALPLSMALAIASGVPPQHGLYTAIVAGALIALLGGSRTQVSGPTAAFIVILAPIAAKHGLGGLLVATLMSGVILVLMGAARMGKLIQFIPHPVTTGFTSGIAVVIATTQVDKLLGLQGKFSDHWTEHIGELVARAPEANLADLAVGGLTFAVLLLAPRVSKKVPAPLVALLLGAVAAALASRLWGLEVTTLDSRFTWSIGGRSGTGIPPLPPLPAWPWSWPGPNGEPFQPSLALFRALVPSAFAIAMLGAIESLLSAVVADGMAGTQHDPDAELVAQGAGNLVAPFFGGIAATGAIARTATNIRAGARTPLAAVVHSLFVLAGILVLAPALGYLPLASMAALLLVVAWNMSEVKHFAHILKVAPGSDVLVLLTCFALTVLMDMVVAVSVGVMLAALVFMRRMANIAEARLITAEHHAAPKGLPKNVLFYEIAGPLFFGAAQKALAALGTVEKKQKILILDIEGVPAMDMTGLVALESALTRLRHEKALVIFSGVQKQPRTVLERGGFVDDGVHFVFTDTLEQAVALATHRAPGLQPSLPPTPASPAPGTPSADPR